MIARFCGFGCGWVGLPCSLLFVVVVCVCLLVLTPRLVFWCVRLWLIWIVPCRWCVSGGFCCGVLVGFGFGLQFWVLLGAAAACLVLDLRCCGLLRYAFFGVCASWWCLVAGCFGTSGLVLL